MANSEATVTTSSSNDKQETGILRHAYRFVYNKIFGFEKWYNFPLFVVFGGALFVFSLMRMPYIDTSATGPFVMSRPPGHAFWFTQDFYRIGITIHLAAILPFGVLGTLQFIPKIRHKFLLFHRINGYIALLCLFTGIAGGVMILRRTFGGDLAVQTMIILSAAMSCISAGLAYYNIKRLQIDQHRKWMLRMVFYVSFIITLRLVTETFVKRYLAKDRGYTTSFRCDELQTAFFGNDELFYGKYPTCEDLTQSVAVKAIYGVWPEEITSAFNFTFGSAGWLALAFHAIGVEVYIHLTPAENERLRAVSYARQAERGHAHPGSSGTVGDRMGGGPTWEKK